MNGIENGKPKESFDEMMKAEEERRKRGEPTDLDDPAVKELLSESERVLRGEEPVVPAEEADEATLVERLQEVRNKRKSTQKALTERFGNRGQKVEGTPGYAWHDEATDSMYVVRKDGEPQEIKKGEVYDFGQKGTRTPKKWEGKDVGWTDVASDVVADRPLRRQQREAPTREQAVVSEKSIDAMTPEERQEEIARLRREAAEKGINVSDIPSAVPPTDMQPTRTAATPDEASTRVRQTQAPNTKKQATEEMTPGIQKMLKGFEEKVEALFKGKASADEPEDIRNLKHQITKAKLENELAGLKPAAKPEETPIEKKGNPKLDAWEFSDNIKLGERGERAKAAFRAREEGMRKGFSEERQVNRAKYFYEIAEKWKKFPLWGKLGISMGLLAAGTVTTAFAAPTSIIAGISWLAAVTWRGVSAAGTGAVLGGTTYTYLKKRNSRHAGWISALVAVASGSAAFFGGKYLAEYLNLNAETSATPVPSSPPPDLTWSGDTQIPFSDAVAKAGLHGFASEHFFDSNGLLAPYGLSGPAQEEFNKYLGETLTGAGNQEFLEQFSPGAKDIGGTVVFKPGVGGDLAVFGNENFLNSFADRIPSDSVLAKELASRGGVEGLMSKLHDEFNRR